MKARRKPSSYPRRIKQEAIALLGGCCAVCGETDLDVLQVDHRHGASAEQLGKAIRGGHGLYLAMVKGRVRLGRLQCLCANHNALKKITNGETRGYKARRHRRRTRCS